MKMFRKHPFRCRSCRRRFYSYQVQPEEAATDDVDEMEERERPRA